MGIFIIFLKLGAMFSNLFWMPIGNIMGTRVLIRSGIFFALISLLVSLFAQNVVLFSLALLLSWMLCEPRHGDTACGPYLANELA